MNKLVVLSLPIALTLIGAVVLLHIACSLLSVIRANKVTRVLSIVLAALNAAAHLGLIAYTLIKDVPASELLLLLMISAAVGTVSMGISERHKRPEGEDV